MSNKPTEWKRTSVQNLLRTKGPTRYYAKWGISGKQKWLLDDLEVFSVAKLRLNDETAKIQKRDEPSRHYRL